MNKLNTFKQQGMDRLQNVWGKFKQKINDTVNWLKDGFAWLVKQFLEYWYVLIPIIITIIAVILEILILKRYLERKYSLLKCRRFYAAAQANFPHNPALCVRMSYLVTRSLLNLGGLARPRNAELLDYGRSLSVVDTNLRKDVVVIFYMFSKLEYSSLPIAEREAAETLERLEKIRHYIYSRIHETAELTTKS